MIPFVNYCSQIFKNSLKPLHQTKYVKLVMNYENSDRGSPGQPDFSAHCLCHLLSLPLCPGPCEFGGK